jgi:hypothetical protein
VFVDADGNGEMDDLNGDGRVTIADAQILFQAAESVEASHPELVGGLSAYPATVAHGPLSTWTREEARALVGHERGPGERPSQPASIRARARRSGAVGDDGPKRCGAAR